MKGFKRATPMDAIKNMLMAKSLEKAGIDYIAVPVKDGAYRAQIIEQVKKSYEEVTGHSFQERKEALFEKLGGSEEDLSQMVGEVLDAAFSGFGKKQGQRLAQDAMQSGELKEDTFKSLDGESMKKMLSQARDKILSAAARKPNMGIRGLVRLGFEDGMGVAVVFTNDEIFYDNIQDAELPGFDPDDKCGDLSCKACHPNAEPDSIVIH